MWPNNPFGNNGQFSNNFLPDDFQATDPFGNPLVPMFPDTPRNMSFDANGEAFNPDFQSNIGNYDEASFMQNQIPHHQAQFSSPNYNPHQQAQAQPQPQPEPQPQPQPQPVSVTPRPTPINDRARELKARLLKEQEIRKRTATPNGASKQTKQPNAVENSISQRGSPKPAMPVPSNEIDIDKLISEFSAPDQTKQETTAKEKSVHEDARAAQEIPPHHTAKLSELPAKSQASSSGSPTKMPLPGSPEKPIDLNDAMNTNDGRRASHVSDISEGEILETPVVETPSKPARLPTVSKDTDVVLTSTKNSTEHPSRPSREELNIKPDSDRDRQQESPRRVLGQQKPQRSRDDRREEQEHRPERRRSQTEYTQERKMPQEQDRRPFPRRELRDQSEAYRRAETSRNDRKDERKDERKNEKKDERKEATRQAVPTLEQLLQVDDDLKDWLDFTGYHNTGFREKKLAAHRQIAALDAQKEKILADLASQEHGFPTVATMPPPPAPTKASDKLIPASNEALEKRGSSNKRTHSDVQGLHENAPPGKIARSEVRARVKDEVEDRRPKSGGYNSSRRSSLDYSHDDRDNYSREEGRTRERADSRELSPGWRGHQDRSAGRSKFDDDDEWLTPRREYSHRGEYVTRGNYRGRAFDSNFRGRGRGRGRGDRDREDYGDNPGPFPRDDLRAQPYGHTIANRKPFKDTKGFSRGGKGDTRYFIVKSFNEENVLRCIEDSIWTTQVHVGEILKEAFQTCQNVILVFSINKSKAFQGYARMESLPGSVEVPSWQKAINWESAGAFKVKWLVICATRFQGVGHLKNSYNDNLAVLIGKDGQEIEEYCGRSLIELIDSEAESLLTSGGWEHGDEDRMEWED